MNMIRRIKVLLLALLGCCLWPVGAVLGTEYTVTMTDYYAFTPSYLEIQVNDVVTWVNQDEYDSHDSVSDDGYWNSGPLYYRDKASLQFPFEGTFGYHDSLWVLLGMRGTIVVNPAPQPVPVTLTDPMRLLDGRFQFSVSNLTVTLTYVIQGSTNLVNWTNITTNVAANTVETWTDNAAATFGRRYYRCYQVP